MTDNTTTYSTPSFDDNKASQVSSFIGDFGKQIEMGPHTEGADFPHSITIRYTSTIIDRFADRRFVEPIWRDNTNLAVLAHLLKDNDVREQCESFFMQQSIRLAVTKLFAVRTLRQGEGLVTRREINDAIRSSAELSADALLAIGEIVIPVFIRAGLVGGVAEDTYIIKHGVSPVTCRDLAVDASSQEIIRVLGGVSVKLPADRKVSPNVFAEELAEAFTPVGVAFTDVNELMSVISDMVTGVRAHIDTHHSSAGMGFKGSIPISWRDNAVIAELAKNVVFVDAALELGHGAKTFLHNPEWKLERYAPVVLAALRSSPRYAFVGRADVGRTWNLRKVRDLTGRVRHAVLFRSAHVYAGAMSVLAYPDVTMPDAYRLSPTRERLAEAITSAYGDTTAMSIDAAAEAYISLATHAVENDVGLTPGVRVFDIVDPTTEDVDSIVRDVLCLKSERVNYLLGKRVLGQDKKLDDVDGTGYMCVPHYYVETSERAFSGGFALAGKFDSQYFITTSRAEAFFAMEEWKSSASLEDRPQMLTKDALNGRIVNFVVESELATLSKRLSFSATFHGVGASGSIRAHELGSMRHSDKTFLVIPQFNRSVVQGVGAAIGACFTIVEQIRRSVDGSAAGLLADSLRRVAAQRVLEIARALSPGFRAEVHSALIERVVRGMDYNESVRMRAQLAQRSFAGYADAFALHLFLAIQGITSSAWDELLRDTAVHQLFFELGSDRKMNVE